MNEFENQVTPNETPAEPTPVEATPVVEPVAPVEPTPVAEVVAEPVAEAPVMQYAPEYATYEPTPAPKKKPLKTIITILAIVLALVIVGVAGYFIYDGITNTPENAVAYLEDNANATSYKEILDIRLKARNGFAQKEIKELTDLFKKTEDYEDRIDDMEDLYETHFEGLEDRYGDDYQVRYVVTDKDKLDKDDLRDFRNKLRDIAENIDETIEETEDFDSDDWEDYADDLGFGDDKSKAKQFIKIAEKLHKVYKSAKVTAGYEVTIETRITGSEVDEPIEDEIKVKVFKVDGRWVMEDVATSVSYY